jgi:hypothetical protein
VASVSTRPRYALFSYARTAPTGGWEDFTCAAESLAVAAALAGPLPSVSQHVVDLEELRIVAYRDVESEWLWAPPPWVWVQDEWWDLA